jgi:hypothetical protein
VDLGEELLRLSLVHLFEIWHPLFVHLRFSFRGRPHYLSAT